MCSAYEKREYRSWVKSDDLKTFQVTVNETDLLISADKNLKVKGLKSVTYYRKIINKYINANPEFQTSFTPVKITGETHPIISTMCNAGTTANTGPFAAVAGAMAEFVGKDLLEDSEQIIIENGGDIFLSSKTDRILGVYAGNSILTGKIGIKIPAHLSPVGICTSSGTVGHSTSFGKADAAIVISKSTALADCVATATANKIKSKEDLKKALSFAQNIDGIIGVVAIIENEIAAWGHEIEFVQT